MSQTICFDFKLDENGRANYSYSKFTPIGSIDASVIVDKPLDTDFKVRVKSNAGTDENFIIRTGSKKDLRIKLKVFGTSRIDVQIDTDKKNTDGYAMITLK